MAKNFDDYVGRLTQEETAELLSVCIREIPIEKVVEEILKLKNRMDLEEIEQAISIHLAELKDTPPIGETQ